MSDLKDQSEELKLEVMKALLTRAAEALEKESWPSEHHNYSGLIDELRKGAE